MSAQASRADAREHETTTGSSPLHPEPREGTSALLIPSREDIPLTVVRISELESIQRLVGGDIQAIDLGSEQRTTVYLNENGKHLPDCLPNPRAQRLMGATLFRGDYIAGDVVISGFDPASGENDDIAPKLRERLLAPGALDAATLRPPERTSELGRTLNFEWLVGMPDREGVQRLMVLSIIHHGSPRYEFHASAAKETVSVTSRSVVRGFHLGTAWRIAREPAARYSAARRERFAGRARGVLAELFALADNRITALTDQPTCAALA